MNLNREFEKQNHIQFQLFERCINYENQTVKQAGITNRNAIKTVRTPIYSTLCASRCTFNSLLYRIVHTALEVCIQVTVN